MPRCRCSLNFDANEPEWLKLILGKLTHYFNSINSPDSWIILTDVRMALHKSLRPIPGLNHQDAAVVQSLLRAAGLFYHVHDGFAETPDVVFIRESDLTAVKEFLRDYRIRGPRDDEMAIPW